MNTENPDGVEVSMSLTARVPDIEGRGGYDLTAEDGEVTIRKVGSANRTPRIAIADLEQAFTALKGGQK